MESEQNYPDEIEVPVWWSNGGGVSFNRDCLPTSHPESTYSYIKNVLGLGPFVYGVRSPGTVKESYGVLAEQYEYEERVH